MAHGFRNVTRNNPCPICGKPDGCGFIMNAEGRTYLYCRRSGETGSGFSVLGNDGNDWWCFGPSKTGEMVCYERQDEREKIRQKRQSEYINAKTERRLKPEVKVPVRDNTFSERKSNSEIDAVYRELISCLVLEDRHREYLKKEGWTDDMIKKYKIVSMPESDKYRYEQKGRYVSKNPWRKELGKRLLDMFGYEKLRGIPGLYEAAEGQIGIAGLGGILFPQFDAKGFIYGLKMRVDRQWYDEKGKDISKERYEELEALGENVRKTGKYLCVSSVRESEKNGVITNIFKYGTNAVNELSYYEDEGNDHFLVWITEGEKKAMFANSRLNSPVISIPGVSSWGKVIEKDVYGKNLIDYMKEWKSKVIIVALDADKSFNDNVLRSESNIVSALSKEGVRVAVAEWDVSIAKGLDDLLNAGYRPHINFV